MAVDPHFASRLAKLTTLKEKVDAPDAFFAQMISTTITFVNATEKMNEKEAADFVISQCTGADKTENRKHEIANALVYLYLTDRHKKYLYYISQMGDAWYTALYIMNVVTIEMFPKLSENCKDSIIHFFREAIKCNVPKLENTLVNFLRTLNGCGDFSSRHRLARDFAQLFFDHLPWFTESIKPGSLVHPMIVMTMSHTVADIFSLSNAREYERDIDLISLAVSACIRKRPLESLFLGRELIFSILRISKLKNINRVFNYLLNSPEKFGLKSIDDVAFKSPMAPLMTNRLSVDLVRKIEFIIGGIRPNGPTKHLEWFTSQHLKGADSMSMRANIIRFLLYYFPQNPQYNIYEARVLLLNWLLNTSTYGPEAQWIKTAIWFDWFFYDPQTPICVVEPALGLTRHCLNGQVAKSNTLLEYLQKEITVMCPPLTPRLTTSTNMAMKAMAQFFADNGQPLVSTIIDNNRLDASVRTLMRNLFPEFVSAAPTEPVKQPTTTVNNHKEVNNEKIKREKEKEKEVKKEEHDIRRSKSPSPPQKRVRQTVSKEEQEKELEINLNQLREDVKEIVLMVKTAFNSEESDDSDKGESVGKLLQKLLENEDSLEEEQHWSIGHCLLGLIGRPEAQKSLVPEINPDAQDPYQEVFSHPLFIVFRNLCFTPANETTSRTPLVRIIAAMREKDNYISILLLYFIKCGVGNNSHNSDNIKCYEEVATASDKEITEMLAEDLETVALEDEKLFGLLLPFVCEKFHQDIGSSPDVLHVICNNMDSVQLSTIIGCMVREGTTLFRKDNICNIVTASMDWSSTSQFMLWQMIHAEGVPLDWMLPIVPKIKSDQHAETAVNMIVTLRRLDREPGMNLLRTILSRPPSKTDFFTIDCFRVLIDDSDMCTRVADLIAQLIKKLINNNELHIASSQAASKAQGKKAAPKLCLEQLLAHMQSFIDHCLSKDNKVAETLLSKWSMQEAFKTITSNDKTTMMKPKFNHLFTVLELLADDSPQSSRTLRGNRGNNNHPAKTKKPKDDDDDLPIPSKQKKRTVVTLDSDSD